MYPRVSDIFKDLLGVELPLPLYSWGAMLAISLLVGGWLTKKELDRLYHKGLISGIRVKDTKADKTHHGNTGEKRWISPSALVPNCILFAAVGGIVGARLFHILENLDAFFRDPVGMIFSSGGLTFYGGMIIAAALIIGYIRKHRLSIPRFADAGAPGLMLGYGIGRIVILLATATGASAPPLTINPIGFPPFFGPRHFRAMCSDSIGSRSIYWRNVARVSTVWIPP